MTQATAGAYRTVMSSDALPNDFVVPFYLDDRKLRISVARVDDRLYAFDDLCTCGGVVSGPTTDALRVYVVREVEDGNQVRA